jgi:hypothetical protein
MRHRIALFAQPRPRAIERLRELREEAEQEKALMAEQALAWLDRQRPREVRQRLEEAARRELGGGSVPVPRAAFRAVLWRGSPGKRWGHESERSSGRRAIFLCPWREGGTAPLPGAPGPRD